MNSRQQRVRAIELTLTPQQVVMVWLRNVLQAGTFEEGFRRSPPHRIAVLNAVYDTVRSSMKGQPDPLVERAIRQAQREADLLYLLVIYTNTAVLEAYEHRRREYVFLFLTAEILANLTKDRLEILRLAVLVFLKSVIILDAAITQVVSEHFDGQPILFRDCEVKLKEQVQLAGDASEIFNSLASLVGSAKINLEELRKSLQSETDHQVSVWISLARAIDLLTFGKAEEMHAARDRFFLLCEPKSGEAKSVSINTAEMTGSYIDANNVYHRFVYDANGTRTDAD